MTLLGGAAPGGHYEWRNTLRQEPRETRGVLDWPPTLTGGGPYEAQGAHGARHRRLPRHWSRDRPVGQIPLKRFGTVEEVGRAVVYIVSSDGDYITGAELSINGGLLM